jgi:DNA polymerase-3 subunit epsilon
MARRDPPPPGPPWDLPLADAPLAFVDLEMTGLDPERDRVVEVCVVRVRGGAVEGTIASLVCPPERIGGSSEIHGLDAAALAGAPTFPEIADACLALLAGAVFVAHAAEWDAKFLAAEMRRAGRAWDVPPFVDTLQLARRSFAFPSYSLDALCRRLAIDRGTAHRADSDVAATRALFARVVDVLKPATVRDLWDVRTGERHARQAIVEGCEAAVELEAEVLVTYRPSGRAPLQMRMILTEVRTDVDPPKVVGYQLPGRGRKELRADRILSLDPAPSGDS